MVLVYFFIWKTAVDLENSLYFSFFFFGGRGWMGVWRREMIIDVGQVGWSGEVMSEVQLKQDEIR